MRTISQDVATILSGRVVPLTILVQLDLTSTIYLNLSPVTINYGGHDWLGAGTLGGVDEISESTGETPSIKLSLSGVPSDMLSLALEEPVRNKGVTISLALLDPTTNAVEDVFTLWTGLLDTMSITQSGETGVVTVTAEPMALEFARPKPFRYTNEEQDAVSSGDTSLQYIISQAQHPDIWPAASFLRK